MGEGKFLEVNRNKSYKAGVGYLRAISKKPDANYQKKKFMKIRTKYNKRLE